MQPDKIEQEISRMNYEMREVIEEVRTLSERMNKMYTALIGDETNPVSFAKRIADLELKYEILNKFKDEQEKKHQYIKGLFSLGVISSIIMLGSWLFTALKALWAK